MVTYSSNNNISYKDSDTSSLVEVSLSHPDDFLKVKETLTRIGVASKREPTTLYQSCHILHKRGKYYIVHFKELFILDGKSNDTDFTPDDIGRRNTIALLLSDWGLLSLVDPSVCTHRSSLRSIKIIPHRDKALWSLVPKYAIGINKTLS